jgi:hypothetical protein
MLDYMLGITIGAVQGVTAMPAYYAILHRLEALFNVPTYPHEKSTGSDLILIVVYLLTVSILGTTLILVYLLFFKLSHSSIIFRNVWFIFFSLGLIVRKLIEAFRGNSHRLDG